MMLNKFHLYSELQFFSWRSQVGGGGDTHTNTQLMQTSEASTMTFKDDALETAKLFYTRWMELVYLFWKLK